MTEYQENIPNYLVQSILVTLFCCMPFGVVGIIFAAQVNSKLAAGDIEGARSASNQAKLWTTIGFVLGAIGVVLYFFLVVISLLAGGGR